jgi:hypothetical protein
LGKVSKRTFEGVRRSAKFIDISFNFMAIEVESLFT